MTSIQLSGLSTKFNLKEATYCTIVAAIVGHLAFFLFQESPKTGEILQQAAQIYHQSKTCDTSVKQAVERIFQLENLFKSSPSNHAAATFLNHFKRSHINHELLAKEAVQAALDNLLSLAMK